MRIIFSIFHKWNKPTNNQKRKAQWGEFWNSWLRLQMCSATFLPTGLSIDQTLHGTELCPSIYFKQNFFACLVHDMEFRGILSIRCGCKGSLEGRQLSKGAFAAVACMIHSCLRRSFPWKPWDFCYSPFGRRNIEGFILGPRQRDH